jgi:ankyrin repeat protein
VVKNNKGKKNLMKRVWFSVIAGGLLVLAGVMNCRATDANKANAPETEVKIKAEKNPIFSAIYKDVNKVKEILEDDPAAVNARDANGLTPLHCLVRLRSLPVTLNSNAIGTVKEVREEWPLSVVELLISKGADVNAKDEKGTTPLHWTVSGGNFALTRLLVENGADVNATVDNEPALEGMTPLFFAAIYGDANTISFLITKGADVNKTDNRGNTPLHVSVAYNQPSSVEVFLKSGAKINIKNLKGVTPLAWAKGKGYTTIVQLLEKAGAKE